MTLNQMRILVQITEAGSLGGAAKTLHRTVPAVSIAMKKLEAELDLELFCRDKYRISLTEIGEVLCQKAKTVLHHSDELDTLSKQLTMGEEPAVRIALVSAVPTTLVLDALKKCEQEFPSTSLSLIMGTVFGPMERLVTGDVDLATVLWMNVNEDLESIPFFKLNLVPVCAPGYLPYDPSRPIPIKALRDYRQVILRSTSDRPDKEYYGRIPDSGYWEVYEDHTKKEIILAGMGWGRLPKHLIQTDLENGSLVEMNISDYPSTTELEVRLARRTGHPVGPVAARLWEHLQRSSPLINDVI